MSILGKIKAKLKTGEEQLIFNRQKTNYNLLDFWSWSVSDILTNATRGRFAEFIVSTAIGFDKKQVRGEWDAYDLTSNEGIKIEVKSSAYIQSWEQTEYSKIIFSIKPAREWDYEIDKRSNISKRHSDIYVFCHLKHKDQDTINPLEMEQWDFYVVSTKEINEKLGAQGKLSLGSLKKLASPVEYDQLKMEIQRIFNLEHLI